ncbi:MAG: ankyrin repeat domain-containing protein [Desulfarculaceae bacterium]|nr:ankyrin repeat domain-containing protein [Desulfarculaceae bacterium]MCF8072920.1 ankyrin repeat domain-containing protein [Desulfarculaceae bacterium]MCF8101088.1 ankyrin repeat domain-containing protein [Desulfarculaceae bacterium]MCF8115525.1 ankyrin repeat domain-containing protein [Desulfarculaceae bacterium]
MKTGRMAMIPRAGLIAAVVGGLIALSLAMQPAPHPLMSAVAGGDHQAIARVLQKQPELIDRTFQGRTPLHLAAMMNFVWGVDILLARGADPNARDALGDTPLHAAAYGIGKHTVPLLLKAGADPNATNHQGLTPLHLAAYCACNPWSLEICNLLLRAGATPRATGEGAISPLKAALIMENNEVAKRLALMQ